MIYALPYIYYFIFTFFCIFSSKTNKQFESVTKILFIFVTIYFIGLRGFVEADWLIYYPTWNNSPVLTDDSSVLLKHISTSLYEKGFSIFLILCKSVCNNYIFIQFIIFIFTLFCLNNFLNRYCKKYYYIGVCLFYLFGGYILSIILIRNCISVMIFLLSTPSLIERHWKKYFALNTLGCLFHTSSLFYFPLYFLLGIQFSPILIILLWIIGNAVFFFQIPVATTIFSLISERFLGRAGRLVISYLNSKTYSASYGISIGYIERFFTFLFFFLNRKKFKNKSDTYFLNMLYLYSLIFLFFTDFRIVVDRIPILLYCCYWILYPKVYEILKKDSKVILLVILLFYSSIKIIMFFGTPIGYYENIITGAMDYETRKIYTLKELKK